MEEAWELAAVSGEEIKKILRALNHQSAGINQIYSTLGKSIVELEKHQIRFLPETKYLILANIAGIYFCIDVMQLGVTKSQFVPQKLYTLIFLLGFLSAVFAYWQTVRLDPKVTVLNLNSKSLNFNPPPAELSKEYLTEVKVQVKDAKEILKEMQEDLLEANKIKVTSDVAFQFSGFLFLLSVILITLFSAGLDVFSLLFR